MSSKTDTASPGSDGSRSSSNYVVVARRYRPQTFEDLVGQEHVARALAGAIESHRVGHAYLFTGARGVGKTSAARILAKCLNCEKGPTPTPCNECDICRRIAAGDDVDVLEIDGASNRGIEEMRELRQNVNVRPSRARFKIYIIDEVHMLTREAFNALLKTLEEPPDHVKIIFCTTEAEKIPITILSRCQRFDFAGIRAATIRERLQAIVQSEGATADDEALQVLARRAAGSMRDSQSLLEQLLGVGEKHISLADVHRLLGTVADEGLVKLMKALAERDAAEVLQSFDRAVGEGVDAGQLLDQVISYFRDCLVVAVGGSTDLLDRDDSSQVPIVREIAERLGPETLIAAIQILEQAAGRLRASSHGRLIVEVALVRICQLERLENLAEVISTLRDGAEPPKKKLNREPDDAPRLDAPASQASRAAPQEAPTPVPDRAATDLDAKELWSRAVADLAGMAGDYAREFESARFSGSDLFVVVFPPQQGTAKAFCERAGQREKLEEALSATVGRKLRLECQLRAANPGESVSTAPARPSNPRERINEIAQRPLISRARELLHATPVQYEEPSGTA